MKEKIWKGRNKYIITAVIVMLIVFLSGAFLITSLDNIFYNNNIEYADVLITDKYVNNNTQHYYVVVDDGGVLYDIKNDTKGTTLYKSIDVGNQYHFVIKKPVNDEKYLHIVQVYNVTN